MIIYHLATLLLVNDRFLTVPIAFPYGSTQMIGVWTFRGFGGALVDGTVLIAPANMFSGRRSRSKARRIRSAPGNSQKRR